MKDCERKVVSVQWFRSPAVETRVVSGFPKYALLMKRYKIHRTMMLEGNVTNYVVCELYCTTQAPEI